MTENSNNDVRSNPVKTDRTTNEERTGRSGFPGTLFPPNATLATNGGSTVVIEGTGISVLIGHTTSVHRPSEIESQYWGEIDHE